MKKIEHYLSDKNSEVWCPFNRSYSCNNSCALFDNEHEDCRIVGMGWKIRESLDELKDIMVFEKQKPVDRISEEDWEALNND